MYLKDRHFSVIFQIIPPFFASFWQESSFLQIKFVLLQSHLPAEFRLSLANIQQTLPAESASGGIALPIQLFWSHYERLIRVPDPDARFWYLHEAASQQWDYRTLKRNIDSQYYYRLAQTPEPQQHEVVEEMHRLTADYASSHSPCFPNSLLVSSSRPPCSTASLTILRKALKACPCPTMLYSRAEAAGALSLPTNGTRAASLNTCP